MEYVPTLPPGIKVGANFLSGRFRFPVFHWFLKLHQILVWFLFLTQVMTQHEYKTHNTLNILCRTHSLYNFCKCTIYNLRPHWESNLDSTLLLVLISIVAPGLLYFTQPTRPRAFAHIGTRFSYITFVNSFHYREMQLYFV